jgi:hypothetical protein
VRVLRSQVFHSASVHDMDPAAETDKTENMQNSHISMFMRHESNIFGGFVGLQATAIYRVLILDRLESDLLQLLQRDAKEKRGKGEERKQETERHTQGTEPTPQPRPTQNTAEAAKATQEYKPTGTQKRNNHTRHKPEKARPPKATRSDTKQKSTTAAQNRKSRTKERALRPGRTRRRRANPDARTRKAAAARGHRAH